MGSMKTSLMKGFAASSMPAKAHAPWADSRTDRRGARATFFFLGWVVDRHPQLVREAAQAGHEVACHGYSHRLIYDQSPEDFRAETLRSKALIEDQLGAPVLGYRAASYSITRKSLWALALPVLVLGGMYAGVFTATEAAAAGAILALAVGVVVYRSVGLRDIWHAAMDASRTSAMLFMILAGASVFGFVLTKMRIPHEIVQWVVAQEIGVLGFLLGIMALVFVLGMFLETIAIILITTPVILPAMAHLGINPVWYGVLLTINLELALITPPVGMNLFTIKAVAKAPIGQVIAGALPYVLLIAACLGLVMAWPQLALWLPGTMLK